MKPIQYAYRSQLVLYTRESLVRDSIGRTVTRRIPLFTPYDHTSEPLPAIRTPKPNPAFPERNHPEEVSTSTSTAALSPSLLLPSLLVQHPTPAVPSTSRRQASPSPATTSGILPTPHKRRSGAALAALAPVLPPRRTLYRDPHVDRLLSKVDRLMACGAGTRAHRGRGDDARRPMASLRPRLLRTLPSPHRPLKL